MQAYWLVAAALLLSAPAGVDEALGTFTVKGRTTTLRYGYVTIETSPEKAEDKYLIALLSDVPVAAADRRSERLLALARAGRLHALKVRWGYGYDDVSCVPYHADVPASGRTHRGYMILDLRALDEKKVKAHVRSKMLGQDWQFDARVEGTLRAGGVAEIEPEVDEAAQALDDAGLDPDRRLRREVGRLGYEFTPQGFEFAIMQGNAEAVRLFLKGGMDANLRDTRGDHPMQRAVTFCGSEPEEARAEVVLALVAGRSDVQAGEGKKSNTLLWAAERCPPRVVRAMLDAGADPNATPTGYTPLEAARSRTDGLADEVVSMLQRAGAR